MSLNNHNDYNDFYDYYDEFYNLVYAFIADGYTYQEAIEYANDYFRSWR